MNELDEVLRFFIDDSFDNVGSYSNLYHCNHAGNEMNKRLITHLPNCPVAKAIAILIYN